MTRENLSKASDILGRAAEDADGEAADRLREQARQLASLAEAERGPDHGRLARHQSVLHEVQEEVDDDVAERIGEANAAINAHRETLEGV